MVALTTVAHPVLALDLELVAEAADQLRNGDHMPPVNFVELFVCMQQERHGRACSELDIKADVGRRVMAGRTANPLGERRHEHNRPLISYTKVKNSASSAPAV